MSEEQFEMIAMSYVQGEIGRRKFLKMAIAGGIGVVAATAVASALTPANAAPPGGSLYGDPPPAHARHRSRRGRERPRPGSNNHNRPRGTQPR